MPGTPAPEKPKKLRMHKELVWSEMEFNCAVYSDVMKVKRKSSYVVPKPPAGCTWKEAFAANPKATYRLLKGAWKKHVAIMRFPKVADWNNTHGEAQSPFRLEVPDFLCDKLLAVGPLNTPGYKYSPDEQLAAEANAEAVRMKKACNILLNFMLKAAKPGTPISSITSRVYALMNKRVERSPRLKRANVGVL